MKFDKVLQVGINYYATPQSRLQGCINDVKNVTTYFLEEKIETKEVLVLCDNRNANDKFYPSRNNLLKALNWLAEGATSDSRLFFQYSGHGTYTFDRNQDETDGRDECICPAAEQVNGQPSIIVDDEIRTYLINRLPARCFLLGLFDCCHSGTALDLKYNYQIFLQQHVKEYRIQSNSKQKETQANVVLFSGCLDTQTSADAYLLNTFQGAMTFAFLKSVRDLKARQKPVSYKNVIKYMMTLLIAHRYPQVPQISSGKFLNLEDLVF